MKPISASPAAKDALAGYVLADHFEAFERLRGDLVPT